MESLPESEEEFETIHREAKFTPVRLLSYKKNEITQTEETETPALPPLIICTKRPSNVSARNLSVLEHLKKVKHTRSRVSLKVDMSLEAAERVLESAVEHKQDCKCALCDMKEHAYRVVRYCRL